MKEANNIKAIILLITYDCNLKCSYCYEPKLAHHKMTFDTAKSIVQNTINGIGGLYNGIIIQFMGGEPLMNFDLMKQVSEWLWGLKTDIRIVDINAPTNGTLLNGEMKEWLTINKDRFKLALSFDGNRLMQNMNRCDSSQRIDLKFFAETYPNVAVKMTLSPDTLQSFFDGYKHLYDNGFNVIEPSLAMGDNIGWKKEHLQILNSELDKFVRFFVEHPQVQRAGDLNLPIFDVLDASLPNRTCMLGPNIECYDYNGDKYPCHLFSPIAIDKKKAKDATNLDFASIKGKTGPCSKCFINKICARCFAINYRDRDNYLLPSAFDCAQYKLFFYANCKLEKIMAHKNGDKERELLVDNIIHLLTTQK